MTSLSGLVGRYTWHAVYVAITRCMQGRIIHCAGCTTGGGPRRQGAPDHLPFFLPRCVDVRWRLKKVVNFLGEEKCTLREKILRTRMRKGPPPYVGLGPRIVNPGCMFILDSDAHSLVNPGGSGSRRWSWFAWCRTLIGSISQLMLMLRIYALPVALHRQRTSLTLPRFYIVFLLASGKRWCSVQNHGVAFLWLLSPPPSRKRYRWCIRRLNSFCFCLLNEYWNEFSWKFSDTRI